MEDNMDKTQKNFVGYEYKEVSSEEGRISFLLDGYENFGWEIDESLPGGGLTGGIQSKNRAVIHLKRDRRIINKTELTRLQRNFEACVSEIEAMERSKTSTAAMWAVIVAVIGTAFMAGATFAATAQPPQIILCILLAIPGFLGWILPFFLYKRIGEKRAKELTPLIEEKYDEIYEICEKGNKLLN